MPAISFTPGTRWWVALCDSDGIRISWLSALATAKRLTRRLNAPDIFEFTLPAEHPQVNILHTDGRPYVTPWRVIKAYREEGPAGAKVPVLRFAGHIWNLDREDQDGDRTTIAVRAMDPFQWLTHRYVRKADGTRGVKVHFGDTAGAQIAKALVERTIADAGACGITTSGGTFDATTAQTLDYDFPYKISDALSGLTDTRTMDIVSDPLDGVDGIFARMSVVSLRGSEKPHVKLAYDRAPRSVSGFHRNESMDEYANDVFVVGDGKALTSATADMAVQADFGVHEFADVFTGINHQVFLDSLATAELSVRGIPLELVTLQPVPENSASPFDDYDVGDFLYTSASDKTGEEIAGLQRAYGYTLDITTFERVSDLVVSKESS